MWFLVVIEVFFVLLVWFFGSVNTDPHIIYLISYIICWSLKDISVFFWWGDAVTPVDKKEGLNHVCGQPFTTNRAINICKGEVPLIFSLKGRYWKMMVARQGNTRNWGWRSLYHVRTYSFYLDACAAAALKKTLNYESILFLTILPHLKAVLGSSPIYSLT